MSTVDDTKDPIPEVMPLIPLRDLVLFPNLVVPLFVGREKSILALEEAMRGDHHVALVAQLLPDTQDPGAADLHVVGCVGTVLQELKLPDGTAKALVEGVARMRIVEYVTTEPYLQVRVESIEEEAASDVETQALMRALVGDFEKAAELGKPIPQEVLMAAGAIEEPGRLADFVAFHLNLKSEEKQVGPRGDRAPRAPRQGVALPPQGAGDPRARLQDPEPRQGVDEQVAARVLPARAAQGDPAGARPVRRGPGRDRRVHREDPRPPACPRRSRRRRSRSSAASRRCRRAAAETGVIRTYLDWLVGLPWTVEDEEKLDLIEAQAILDEDHYGLEKVKERILEYLAVHKLTDTMRGPILCFVGPPGVGKTSIGKSIARALGRKFIRHVARRRARRGRDPRAPPHLRRGAARPHHPVDQPRPARATRSS